MSKIIKQERFKPFSRCLNIHNPRKKKKMSKNHHFKLSKHFKINLLSVGKIHLTIKNLASTTE
jgi:hypothetical protein